jgi:hypothetical protein
MLYVADKAKKEARKKSKGANFIFFSMTSVKNTHPSKRNQSNQSINQSLIKNKNKGEYSQ